jgi:hypothetical protein
MLYASRDQAGRIVSVSETRSDRCEEELAADHPDVRGFLLGLDADQLAGTDQSFIRVLEDLIELLISRNVLRFTDLPTPAQEKMLQRQQLRDRLRPHLDLLDEDAEDPLV